MYWFVTFAIFINRSVGIRLYFVQWFFHNPIDGDVLRMSEAADAAELAAARVACKQTNKCRAAEELSKSAPTLPLPSNMLPMLRLLNKKLWMLLRRKMASQPNKGRARIWGWKGRYGQKWERWRRFWRRLWHSYKLTLMMTRIKCRVFGHKWPCASKSVFIKLFWGSMLQKC